MALIRVSGDVLPITRARPAAKSTLTVSTPGIRDSTRASVLAHPPHVIPEIESIMLPVLIASNPLMKRPSFQETGMYIGFPVAGRSRPFVEYNSGGGEFHVGETANKLEEVSLEFRGPAA